MQACVYFSVPCRDEEIISCMVQSFARKEEKSVLGIRIHHMQRAEMHRL